MDLSERIKQQKSLLRKEIRQKKRQITPEVLAQESAQIFHMVEQLPQFNNAKTVLAYWSMPDEVQTHDFILRWYQKKQILLPLVVGDVLELREFTGMDCMRVGPSFGILEPQDGPEYNNQPIDFAIIPGVAFDNNKQRMGRGKGYYDKLLNKQHIYKAGVALNLQMVDSVPTNNFDIAMDIVIHPKYTL